MVFQNDERVFFVMDYVAGGDLQQHLEQHRTIPEERAKFYAYTLAIALGHLHENSIVHRDLKPENVMIGEDGYPRLGDFGLSRVLILFTHKVDC